MNQNEYWNSVAEEKNFTTVLDVELFSKYVSKDCKILDVGCGYGRILNELAEAGFTDLTGVDSAKNMIKRGLREYPELNLVANPDGVIPFENNFFDAVILFGVLTCVPDNESQQELLNNIKKVLKPGGIIYINDFLLNSGFKRRLFYKKAQKKTGIYGAFKTYDGATVRHHAEDYILELLSGFKTLDYKKFVIPTMNGNKSNSFGFIGELKK
ncbi:MAG: class I SAM-dependent methyltransferase [Clostridia bacterium]|nr:class I SAM-dependent methyltransferase [Clostridia bacterium]